MGHVFVLLTRILAVLKQVIWAKSRDARQQQSCHFSNQCRPTAI